MEHYKACCVCGFLLETNAGNHNKVSHAECKRTMKAKWFSINMLNEISFWDQFCQRIHQEEEELMEDLSSMSCVHTYWSREPII